VPTHDLLAPPLPTDPGVRDVVSPGQDDLPPLPNTIKDMEQILYQLADFRQAYAFTQLATENMKYDDCLTFISGCVLALDDSEGVDESLNDAIAHLGLGQCLDPLANLLE